MKIKNLIMSAMLAAGSVQAASLQHEITGATNVKLDITGVDGESTTRFDMKLGYNYTLNEFLQIGGLLSYSHYSGANALDLRGVGVYNFVSNFADAFFAEGRVGLKHEPDSTNFQIGVFGGKRFEITPHVSFRPHVGFDLGFGDHSSFTFELMPVAFSVWF